LVPGAASPTPGDLTTCICSYHYTWVYNTCLYDCSVDPNAIPELQPSANVLAIRIMFGMLLSQNVFITAQQSNMLLKLVPMLMSASVLLILLGLTIYVKKIVQQILMHALSTLQ
jgi:hypothetical protein